MKRSNRPRWSAPLLSTPELLRGFQKVPGRRQAEQASIFPAELVRAFVADAECDRRRAALAGDQL